MNLPHPLHEFFRDLTALGGMSFYALMLLFTLLFRQYGIFFDLALGLLLMLVVLLLIRTFYFKDRPLPQDYHTFLQKIDASSFPSLHTARIFFLALYLSVVWNKIYITIFLLIIASSVSYSRIYLQKHDWWDVLGGIVLAGIVLGVVRWV